MSLPGALGRRSFCRIEEQLKVRRQRRFEQERGHSPRLGNKQRLRMQQATVRWIPSQRFGPAVLTVPRDGMLQRGEVSAELMCTPRPREEREERERARRSKRMKFSEGADSLRPRFCPVPSRA